MPSRFPRIAALSVTSGFLLALSYPKTGWGALAWVALALLGMALLRSVDAREASAAGWVVGAIEATGTLSWIPPVLLHYGGVHWAVSWALFLALAAALALFPAAACGAAGWCMRRCGDRLLFSLPLFWVLQEWVLSRVPFGGFPWLSLGYSQTGFLPLIQIADVTGVYGVTVLVAWGGVALAWPFARSRRSRSAAVPLLAGVSLTVGCLGYGYSALNRWGRLVPDRTVGMLQANISIDDSDSVMAWKFEQGYLLMAERLPRVDLLVIPESPAPTLFQVDAGYRRNMEALAKRFPLGLILSNIAHQDVGGTTRYFNSAYFLGPDGRVSARYDKVHLVPFGEYVPMRNIFSFVDRISRDVGAFAAGADIVTAPVGGGTAGAIICFEAVFPGLCRRFVNHGSQLLVNLTNDAWYGNSSAPWQHLAIARWRSVENRRYLLRSTNSGVSAVIDPLGRVHSPTRLLAEDTCISRFAFVEERTFYSRHGDLLVLACAIICVLALTACAFAPGKGNAAAVGLSGGQDD